MELINFSNMGKQSAGILCYRKTDGIPEVLLVHPGGPFWKNKEDGAWSVPKGEFSDDEEALAAAVREFREETGLWVTGTFEALTPVKLSSGKIIFAWAIEADPDLSNFRSNTFSIEWPPRSGKQQSFPETDRIAWFDFETAGKKINAAQVRFITELGEKLKNQP